MVGTEGQSALPVTQDNTPQSYKCMNSLKIMLQCEHFQGTLQPFQITSNLVLSQMFKQSFRRLGTLATFLKFQARLA